MNAFLGIPLEYWAVACLVLAVIWAVAWPRKRSVGAGRLRTAILHWGHSLVWLLLAISVAIRAFFPINGLLSDAFALAALAMYVAFLAALFIDRKV